MPGKPTNYHAYVLRCWLAIDGRREKETYRFSLENPHSGERLAFAGWDSLFRFLSAQLSGAGSPSPETHTRETGDG